MIRKLTTSIATLALALTLALVALAPPASAFDRTLPYAEGPTCGAMVGPPAAQELTYYVFAYRINGGAWEYSRWNASYGTSHWEYYYSYWAPRKVNVYFVSEINRGDRVQQYVYVSRASYRGWLNLGECGK